VAHFVGSTPNCDGDTAGLFLNFSNIGNFGSDHPGGQTTNIQEGKRPRLTVGAKHPMRG